MTTYYWVGGNGTWSGTSTTNWASVSGGTGGAGVPTNADDVVFDSNSGIGTVLAVYPTATCKNFTVTATQAIYINGNIGDGVSTGVYGNLYLPASGSAGFSGLYIALLGASTGKTVNANGKFLSSISFYQAGSWTILSGWVAYSTCNINTGATVDFGTSTITITNSYLLVSSGCTIIANNANFNLAGGIFSLSAPFAVNNFTVNPYSNTVYFFGISSAVNVTFNASMTYQTEYWILSFTCTGTFTSTGDSTYRNIIIPYASSTARPTITAAAVSLTNTDFSKIIGDGAATWSGTSVGDGGGNTGITFDVTPRTLYWVGGTGTVNFTNTTNWSASSGGSGGEPIPKVCDKVVFDLNSGIGTCNFGNAGVDAPRLGEIECRSTNITLTGTPIFFGNLTLYSGMTASAMTLICKGYNQTITTNGVTVNIISLQATASTVYFGSNISGNNVLITSGNLDTQNYNYTQVAGTAFQAAGANPITLNLGSSVLSVYGLTINSSSNVAATVNAGTSEIKLTRNVVTSVCTLNSVTLNKLTFNTPYTAAAPTLNISGTNNTIKNLSSAVTRSHSIKFTGGSSNTINDWAVSGTSGNEVTIGVQTGTTPFTLVSGGSGTQGADYLSVSYSTATPSLTWYAGSHSTDAGNNSGWIFADEPVTPTTPVGNGLLFGSNF